MTLKFTRELSSYIALIFKFKSYSPERIEELWQQFYDRHPESIEICIPYGWKHIALALDECIVALDPGYSVAQLKEKFCGSRYYVDFSEESSTKNQEIIHKVISFYESLSYITCVQCGKFSGKTTSSFKLPVCDSCKDIL